MSKQRSPARDIKVGRYDDYFFKKMMEASNDGFWDWDIPSGHVTFGGKWGEMLGYSIEELEPNVKTWEQLVHPDDIGAVKHHLQNHLSGKTDHYQVEHRLLRKDGKWRWILDRGQVIERDMNGSPVRACGAHIDITEKKQLELERENLSKERDQLLGVVSHELKNPMQAILSGIETIEKTLNSTLGTTLIPTALQSMRRALRRMIRLVADLLESTKIEDGRIQLKKIATTWLPLIDTALAGLPEEALGKRIVLDLQNDATNRILADPGRIVQIITNLIDNAIKFSPEHSTITISTHQDSNSDILRIRDTGRGIAPQHWEDVFQRFWQSKDTAGHGSGLGLYIARGLAEAHGGTLRVIDTHGPGASFELRLPRSPSTEAVGTACD